MSGHRSFVASRDRVDLARAAVFRRFYGPREEVRFCAREIESTIGGEEYLWGGVARGVRRRAEFSILFVSEYL